MSISTIKSKLISFYSGQENITSSTYRTSAVSNINSNAKKYYASSTTYPIQANGSWADIDYTSYNTNIHEHANRILYLARGYKVQGQSLYGNSALKTQIENAIIYLNDSSLVLNQVNYPYTSADAALISNVTYNIGISFCRSLAEALILVSNDISSTALNIGISQLGSHKISFTGSASNYVTDSAVVSLVYILLTNNTTEMANFKNNLELQLVLKNNTYISAGTGVHADYSYLDHGSTFYTNAYGGKSFIYPVIIAVYSLIGSEYAVQQSTLTFILDFLTFGVAPTVKKGVFDYSTKGRGITDGLNTYIEYYIGILCIGVNISNSIGYQNNDLLISYYRSVIDANVYTFNKIESAQFAKSSYDLPHTPQELKLSRAYFDADYYLHRNNNYFLSIKSLSKRTLTSDIVSGNNKLSALSTHGLMWLTIDGSEYNNKIEILDWERLPGVTVPKKPNIAVAKGTSSTYNPYSMSTGFGVNNTKSFVGGVSNGNEGMAVMDFEWPEVYSNVLTFRKSWTFFNDYTVFITSNIDDSSGYDIETVIDQRPCLSANLVHVNGIQESNSAVVNTVKNNVSWITSNNVGYYFPYQENLNIKKENRSGSLSLISTGSSTTVVSSDVFTIWKNHGKNINSNSISYVVVPNKTNLDMQNWINSKNLSILYNDNFHRVEDILDKKIGIIFWQKNISISSVNFPNISSDTQCILFAKKINDNSFEFSFSDPNHTSGNAILTIDGLFTLNSVNSNVTVSQNAGKTYITIVKNSPYYGSTNTFQITGTFGNSENVAAPSNLVASRNGSSVTLTWTDNSNNENGFIIEKNNSIIYTSAANATQYIDTVPIDQNGIYVYRVKAIGSSLESNYSNTATIEVFVESGSNTGFYDNIVVKYDFLEGSGTTINDTSGVSTESDVDIVMPQSMQWIPDGGLTFAGNTYAYQTNGSTDAKLYNMINQNVLTFEAYIKPVSTDNGASTSPDQIFAYSSTNAYRTFSVGQVHDTIGIALGPGNTAGTYFYTAAGTLESGVSKFITLVFDIPNDVIKLYINGVYHSQINSSSISSISFPTSFFIALGSERGGTSGTNHFYGDINYVAIHNAILTDEQILKNYEFITGVPSSDAIVFTGSASNITYNSATLNGIINPNGNLVSYYFDYGTTTSYGQKTEIKSLPISSENINVSESISNLTENTAYHFRLVVINN